MDDAASRPTVYLETTIVSYLTARASRDIIVFGHQEITRQWWEEERKRYRVLVSPRVILEAQRGDPAAAQKRLQALQEAELLAATPEILPLAETLLAELPMPKEAAGDAFHLAYAILYELDYLLTWNCLHLANARVSRLLANMARQHGFWLPIICTPEAMVKPREEV